MGNLLSTHFSIKAQNGILKIIPKNSKYIFLLGKFRQKRMCNEKIEIQPVDPLVEELSKQLGNQRASKKQIPLLSRILAGINEVFEKLFCVRKVEEMIRKYTK